MVLPFTISLVRTQRNFMKMFKRIITLTLALMASTSWSAQFVDPVNYEESQKPQLILFAHEYASKTYILDTDEVVDYMTENLVNACIWLAENAEDRALLQKVVDAWKEDGGDYMMMKYDYQQAVIENEAKFVDGYLF